LKKYEPILPKINWAGGRKGCGEGIPPAHRGPVRIKNRQRTRKNVGSNFVLAKSKLFFSILIGLANRGKIYTVGNRHILSELYYYTMDSGKSKKQGETIGDKIQKLRLKQGLTQDKLARKCDIPYATLTKIESNVITKPSIQTVVKIAAGLEISIDELIK